MKRIIGLLILIMLISVVGVYAETTLDFSSSSSEEIRGLDEAYPNLHVTEIRQDPYPATPGSFVDLYLTVDSIGGEILDPRFEFVMEYPFTLEPSFDALTDLPVLSSKDKLTLHYRIAVDELAVQGDYEIEVRAFVEGNNYYPYFFDMRISNVVTDFDMALQEVDDSGVSLAMSNIGGNTAYSITVRLEESEGFQLIGPSSYIIGNLNMGDYTIVNVLVNPTNITGLNEEKLLSVFVDYTDTQGHRRTLEKQIPIIMTYQVKKGFESLQQSVFFGQDGKTPKGGTGYLVLCVVLLIILASTVVYYRKKLKKK